MKSRYLHGLESRVRSASGLDDQCTAQAEIAAYYARQGEEGKALSLLSLLRSSNGAALSGRSLAWVNFAEGLVECFSGRTAGATTKWERAKALAGASECAEVSALASAWLAFSAYLAEDLSRLEREFEAAIQSVTSDNASALARLNLTLGLCFHYGGDIRLGSEHYSKSRLAANTLGDEVALSALIHDMASMTIAFRRNAELLPERHCNIGKSLLTTVETAGAYEELVGVSAAASLGSVLQAFKEILDSNWADAIEQIDSSLAGAEKDGFGRVQPALLADRAYCLAKLGQKEAAREDVKRAILGAEEIEMHGDDRAVMLTRLSKTYELLAEPEEMQRFAEMARDAWVKVFEFKSRILEVAAQLRISLESRASAEDK